MSTLDWTAYIITYTRQCVAYVIAYTYQRVIGFYMLFYAFISMTLNKSMLVSKR